MFFFLFLSYHIYSSTCITMCILFVYVKILIHIPYLEIVLYLLDFFLPFCGGLRSFFSRCYMPGIAVLGLGSGPEYVEHVEYIG